MLSVCRLHVIGASGSGTTTLGRALATLWSVPHADADDYFWIPTVPPFVQKRREQERLDLMQALFLPRDAWVLSGSMISWGDPLKQYLDAVVLLTLDPEMRLDRLRKREAARYGDAIAPGGSRAEAHQAFLAWARGYDADFDGRSSVARGLGAYARWPGAAARQRRDSQGTDRCRRRLGCTRRLSGCRASV